MMRKTMMTGTLRSRSRSRIIWPPARLNKAITVCVLSFQCGQAVVPDKFHKLLSGYQVADFLDDPRKNIRANKDRCENRSCCRLLWCSVSTRYCPHKTASTEYQHNRTDCPGDDLDQSGRRHF